MAKGLAFLLLIVVSGVLFSCQSYQQSAVKEPPPSKYYTTAFPNRDISKQLKDAQESILRILVTNFYNTYIFGDRYVTLADIRTNKLTDIASDYFSSEESTAGTSIVLEFRRDKVLLITCNHVVSAPDTVISYYEGDDIPSETYVKSISLKQRQNNLIFSPQDLQDFDVVAADPLSDLALLSTSLSENIESLKHPLRFAPGNNDFLQMGSFLYIMGYPKGYLMTTRGLASNSEPQSRRFFVTDAIFNPGISGGLVFASKDNFRSFQWVGMARSATARTEDVLIPRPDSDSEKYSKVARPYRDSVFVQKKTRISYGITQAIPINGIKSFISDNKRAILKSGFSYSAE